MPVCQPIGRFYVGAMEARDLVAISWADIRRISPDEENPDAVVDEGGSPRKIGGGEDEFDTDDLVEEEDVRFDLHGFEEFLGIQRELSTGRISELKKYVQTVDATFPTAVLLAISSDHARFNESTGELFVVRHSGVAKIIDGQHRIAGLRDFQGDNFQVNVAVFVDMDIQDQAMVFATINLKQTKVNKSLAVDLYEFTTSRSPQKTCHDIVRFLDGRRGSPFHGRVKMLGVALEPTETITQATFVDRLLRLVSVDPMRDRDQLRRGNRLELVGGARERRQIFRNFFIKEEDHIIALIIWNFFLAVQRKWPVSWREVERGNILNRTTGFGALMRFMRVAYLSMGMPVEVVKADEYAPIMEKIRLQDGTFTPDAYLPGSSGERALFDQLVEMSQLESFR